MGNKFFALFFLRANVEGENNSSLSFLVADRLVLDMGMRLALFRTVEPRF